MKNQKFEDAIRTIYEQFGEDMSLTFDNYDEHSEYGVSIEYDKKRNEWSVWVEILNEETEKHIFLHFENAVAFAGAKLVALRDRA